MKKALSLILATSMAVSLAACTQTKDAASSASSTANASSETAATAAPLALTADNYVPTPSSGAKYTVEVTDDGWVKIENEGGETLGLSQKSGVHVIEQDGYAFKDLNQNGKLDVYEDWRQTTEDRANDLVNQMSGEEKAMVLSHGGWGDFTTEPLTVEDESYLFLSRGGRGGVTRNLPKGGGDHAKWTNELQAVAESCWYGIPAMISIDPVYVSGLTETEDLAASMNTDLAAKVGQSASRQYRAAGVTALLGPQVDLASPQMARAGTTYGEDPQLTKDIITAYVNAMQSTYDENGNDLGWGDDSVYCFTKHWAGAGSTEAGRNDHNIAARYAVYPGNNFEAHLIPYVDGAFNLPGKTGSAGIMTQYSINVDGDGGRNYGGEWAGVYNQFMYDLLDAVGHDSLIISDWNVFTKFGVWGAEDLPGVPDRIALAWERGMELLGGYGNMDDIEEAYQILTKNVGEDEANAIVSKGAHDFFVVMLNQNMFDQPYNDSAYAESICYSDSAKEEALEAERQAVVMLKNDGTIKQQAAPAEKPTVYIPYGSNTGFNLSGSSITPDGDPIYAPALDLEVMGQYFNVITDTETETNEDGDCTAIERAPADKIAGCDYILVGMKDPYRPSYDSTYVNGNDFAKRWAEGSIDPEDDVWYPASLQYKQYTATKARDKSIAGLIRKDGTESNRSYNGNSTVQDSPNYGDFEALEYARSVAGDIPVIVAMTSEHSIMWGEVEPLADVILLSYVKTYNDVIAEIILGQTEPSALLVAQQPASMDAVETQYEDVPRDMECYVDANGNTYDFAFGLNWSGVINDERVQKYSAAPLTKLASFDFPAFKASHQQQ